jgi:hypothetical protein
LKDFLAETCFEKGWESVDRNFRKLSRAAECVKESSPDEIYTALNKLSSQVDLFADLWLHFHMRFEALVHEYNLDIGDSEQQEPHQDEGRNHPV